MIPDGIPGQAGVADSPSALASLMRLLRRREARDRQGPLLAYRDIAKATGWSLGSVCAHFAGTAVAPPTASTNWCGCWELDPTNRDHSRPHATVCPTPAGSWQRR
jgi:hypothetical protein